MSSIFLAHSSSDKPFVRRVAADLAAAGVRVWFDEAELVVGDSLVEKIQKAIKDMEYLGIILSPTSVKSKWVRKELETGLAQELSLGQVKVLTILHKECDIPPFLQGKLWADFTNETRYEVGINQLIKRLAPMPGDFEKIFVPLRVGPMLWLAIDCVSSAGGDGNCCAFW